MVAAMNSEDEQAYFRRIRENTEERDRLLHPAIKVQFTVPSTAIPELKRPLPQGSLQIYTQDASGPVWLGNGSIPDTPVGERLSFSAGFAKGFEVERRGLDLKVEKEDAPDEYKAIPTTYTYALVATVKNHRREVATVTLREPVFEGWEILEASHPYTRVGPNAVDFAVPVKAGRSARLRYRVRTAPVPVYPPAPVANQASTDEQP
jgi:hypothetical protein